MPYYVYCLYSRRSNRLYIGISNNVARRLVEHNAGQVRPTRPYKPWTVIYQELVGERGDARIREKNLKSGWGREFLKQHIPG